MCGRNASRVRDDLPTGTVTFLFTDVEGSTRLLHEFGAEGYAKALAEHRRVIREACARHDGVEVDTQGDAFFFAFPTAPGAVTAAEEMTEALALGPIAVRIGLHTGTPLVTEEGYVGGDVHFAARVAASSHGGQVVLSSATAERVEFDLLDLGEHRLKVSPLAQKPPSIATGPEGGRDALLAATRALRIDDRALAVYCLDLFAASAAARGDVRRAARSLPLPRPRAWRAARCDEDEAIRSAAFAGLDREQPVRGGMEEVALDLDEAVALALASLD